ncbi:hypothetical protein EV659_109157, partial [Rhodothalassium salexigens DSM 2132]
IPQALLTCPPIPDPPTGPDITQADVARWAVETATAARHCRRDLIAVRRLVNGRRE